MIIYFLVAVLSLGCVYFGLQYRTKSKRLGWLLIVAGIVLPCLLAACRSVEVGTDTNGYISHLFELAQKTDSPGEFFSVAKSWYMISDPLYVILNFLVAHVFNNFHVFLFIAELLIIFPIFFALYKSKKSGREVMLGMVLFFLFEYNVTFNMLRQGIAISFIILMVHYLMSNRNLKSLLCLLVAVGFHSVAVICLPFLLMYWILKKVKVQNRKIVSAAAFVLLVAFVIFFDGVVALLYNTGIYEHGRVFLERYSRPFDFSFTDTATYLVAIVVYWIGSKHTEDRNKYDYDFYMMLGVGGLILLSLGWKVLFLERVSFYMFYPFLLYAVPKIERGNERTERGRISRVDKLTLALIAYFVIYWIVEFAVFNVHNTVPYKFAYLGGVI